VVKRQGSPVVPLQVDAKFNQLFERHQPDILARFLRRLDGHAAEEAPKCSWWHGAA
jgi:hypothetical protein